MPMLTPPVVNSTTDEFISIAEAVRRGYGSRTRIWRHIKAGDLMAVRMGRENRVSVADLDAMVNAKPAPLNEAAYLDLVRRTVAMAPALSPEQATRLRAILARNDGTLS